MIYKLYILSDDTVINLLPITTLFVTCGMESERCCGNFFHVNMTSKKGSVTVLFKQLSLSVQCLVCMTVIPYYRWNNVVHCLIHSIFRAPTAPMQISFFCLSIFRHLFMWKKNLHAVCFHFSKWRKDSLGLWNKAREIIIAFYNEFATVLHHSH